MQGFRSKYYPQGWRFLPKTGGLTLLSVQSRNYLCAQNENDWLMRLTERRKMEVNENRGRLCRKKLQGKIRKKESPKGKRHHRKREKGKPQQRKYDCFRSDGTCSAGWQQSFFPVCPAVCGRLFHSWGRLTHSAFTFRFRQKRQRKKKNHLKTRKSTSWHRRKRKGHCFICLNIV